MKAQEHVGIDQYGNKFFNLGPHPRKALMERLGFKGARKIYIDVNGKAHHIGWAVGPHWVDVKRVLPLHDGD